MPHSLRTSTRISVLLVAALYAARPLSAQTPDLSFDIDRFTLPNGLVVALHRMPHVPVVTVMTTYRVGRANDPPGRWGFAHFVEHVSFKGSHNVPTGRYAELLTSIGGGGNAVTTPDRTTYASWGASEGIELILYLEAERMAFARDEVDDSVLALVRDVVIRERAQRIENEPYGNAYLILLAAMYGKGDPYYQPPFDPLRGLSTVTVDDLNRFHATYYVPSNAVVVVAGDIDVAETRRLVEKWFGTIPAGDAPPAVAPAPTPAAAEENHLVSEQDVPAARLYLGWRTPPEFAPGNAALEVIAQMLGGADGRLQRRLVNEMHLAQDVRVFQEAGARGSELFIAVTARSDRTLDELNAAIVAELRDLQTNPPDAETLTRILNQTELRFLRGIESTGARAEGISSYLYYGRSANYFADDLARFRTLSPEDVSAAARTFLPSTEPTVLSIVPIGQADLAVSGSTPVAEER